MAWPRGLPPLPPWSLGLLLIFPSVGSCSSGQMVPPTPVQVHFLLRKGLLGCCVMCHRGGWRGRQSSEPGLLVWDVGRIAAAWHQGHSASQSGPWSLPPGVDLYLPGALTQILSTWQSGNPLNLLALQVQAAWPWPYVPW